MKSVRMRWMAAVLAVCIVPAFAQQGGAQPAKEPAKEPAKPAAPAAKETAKEAPKPAEKPAATTAAAATSAAAVGKPAPAFALKSIDGKEVKLADYKDKIVVLEWMNHGCPVCARHAKGKTASSVMGNFKDKPVVWLGIDSTKGADAKMDGIKSFIKDNGLSFPYLMDPNGAMGKAYGAKTTPHCFVIDQKGNLAYSGAIDDDADGSKGAKAKNYVKEAIDALLKGSTVASATTEPYGCSVKY